MAGNLSPQFSIHFGMVSDQSEHGWSEVKGSDPDLQLDEEAEIA